MENIRKVLFLFSAYGTRVLPVAMPTPIEMLTIAKKPLNKYSVEDAVAVCANALNFLSGHNKPAIEDHFFNN